MSGIHSSLMAHHFDFTPDLAKLCFSLENSIHVMDVESFSRAHSECLNLDPMHQAKPKLHVLCKKKPTALPKPKPLAQTDRWKKKLAVLSPSKASDVSKVAPIKHQAKKWKVSGFQAGKPDTTGFADISTFTVSQSVETVCVPDEVKGHLIMQMKCMTEGVLLHYKDTASSSSWLVCLYFADYKLAQIR